MALPTARAALAATLVVAGCGAQAAPSSSVADVLATPLLAPGQTLGEIGAFLDERLPTLEPPAPGRWRAEQVAMRRAVLERAVHRGEAAAWRGAPSRIEEAGAPLEPGAGYRIRKLRFEAVPGLWVPALVYEPLALSGPTPVVVNFNGHEADGKAVPHEQIRCINEAKRGLIAVHPEWVGMGQLLVPGDSHDHVEQLDLCGTSGVAPFELLIRHSIDLARSLPHADPARIVVTGLSGGGWQTLLAGALDERVAAVVPVAGFEDLRTRALFPTDLGDSEQVPVDVGAAADYSSMVALLAPRPTLLIYNAADDCCFRADRALPPLVAAAAPIYAELGNAGGLRTYVNQVPGTHNYEVDNREQLYAFLGATVAAGAPGWDATEIPVDDEVQTPEALAVDLPADNLDLHQLALAACAAPPSTAAPTAARLASVLRAPGYDVAATEIADLNPAATGFTLQTGPFTAPAVEFLPETPTGLATASALVIADGGRAAAAPAVEGALAGGHRVLALDLLLVGEARPGSEIDFAYSRLIATAGARLLGQQAAQLAAAARWLRARTGAAPPTVIALGPRSSLAALAAAVLAPDDLGALELHGAPGSLRDLVEADRSLVDGPELFTFGMLPDFDVPALRAQAAPRPIDLLP